jgi:hypothetical protein
VNGTVSSDVYVEVNAGTGREVADEGRPTAARTV